MKSTPNQAQLLYANVLEWGTRLGITVLVLSFAAYCFGWLAPIVPLDAMPRLWGHPVADYLKRSGLPIGWGWVHQVTRGDVANLVGIAILSGVSMVAMLALLPGYVRRRDWIYALIAAFGVGVILLAASAVLSR